MSSALAEVGTPTWERPATGPRDRLARWRWTLPFLAYWCVQVAQVAVLHRLVPRFFWLDDSQAQFGSMFWWLGNNLDHGVPPLADPGQGVSGNVTADMQYGSFDPLHWAVVAVLGQFDNVLTMAWVYGAGCMVLLGTGVLALLRRHGVRADWAVAVSLGIASSGFFLWYGSFWWPLMWGSAWLPWLWLGLSIRGPRGVLVTGLATWAVLASGNPYSLPFALVVVLAQLVEYRRAATSWRRLLGDRVARGQAVALVGGSLVALPTLLNGVQMAAWTVRQPPDPVIGNAGSAVPNLLDALLGGPTLLGQTNAFSGPIGLVPALSTFLLTVPLLAFVRWRVAIGRPGVLTGAALTAAGIMATQLPTVVGPFRFPFRYLVVLEIALPLLVVLALAAANVVTRPRLAVSAGLVLAQVLLATSRAPALWTWHLAALLLTAVALTALVTGLRTSHVVRRVSAVVLVAASASSVVLSERLMVDVQQRLIAERAYPGSPDQPYRDIGVPGQSGAEAMAHTVQGFRDRSILTDRTATVYAWGFFAEVFGADRGWAAGFFPGNANLLAGATVGTGYVTSPHRSLGPVLCTSYVGSVGCADTSRALQAVPGTSRPWVDVLAADTVVLSDRTPPDVRAYFDAEWERDEQVGVWTFYEREATDRHPGRVAVADGVEVAPHGWSAGLARIGRPQESYVVTTAAHRPGTLLLRVPYWPGHRATVDGRPVEVRALEGALVQVVVPAGVRDGRLEVTFAPVGAVALVPAVTTGVLLIALDVIAVALWARRARARPALVA